MTWLLARKTPQMQVRLSLAYHVLQMGSADRLGYIAEQLAAVAEDEAGAPAPALRVGDRCVAKFSADGQWYRAQACPTACLPTCSGLDG